MPGRIRTILTLGLPIIGAMVSQNVLNLVDLAMVATLGDAAVAAVGIGGFANFLATAFITGLSAGVQAMSARRVGEGRHDETALPLNGALLLALLIGIPWSAVLYGLVPWAFPALNPDPAVVSAGVPYLEARILAVVAVGMNFSFRGYWNGINLPRLYLRTLLIMHACNIFFNWVFIFGKLGVPPMGAAGAGVASAISTWIGTCTYVTLGWRHARDNGFLAGLPTRHTLKTILRLAVPTGFQQLSFAAGFTALFWIIGHGSPDMQQNTAEVAAANAVVNVTLVALLPGIALGIASASLVGQALGRGDSEDARRWAWDVVKVAVVVMGLLGLPMLLFPDGVLVTFLHDEATLAIARPALRLVGAAIGIDAVGLVLMHSLLGAGASRLTMVVSIATQWGVFLPIAFVLGPVLNRGLFAIWLAQVCYRALVAVVFFVLWQRGRWARIEV
jgi:multidrug resistance protein, MATE family